MSRKEVVQTTPKEFAKYIGFVAIALLAVLSTNIFLGFAYADIGFVGFLLLLAVGSRIPQKFAPDAWPIELVTLAMFVAALKYGSLAGALVGASALGLSRFFTIERPQDVVVAMIGMSALAVLAPWVYGIMGTYALAGLILVLIYDLGTGIFYTVTGHSFVGCFKFALIHVPLSYLIIKYGAEFLIGF
ncbi:MAG: hypothetical protein ABIG20_05510 [archaeon]